MISGPGLPPEIERRNRSRADEEFANLMADQTFTDDARSLRSEPLWRGSPPIHVSLTGSTAAQCAERGKAGGVWA